jgi:hypothetical protein
MAQAVEHRPSKLQALNSTPSTKKQGEKNDTEVKCQGHLFHNDRKYINAVTCSYVGNRK